jgi:hypothetical protein
MRPSVLTTTIVPHHTIQVFENIGDICEQNLIERRPGLIEFVAKSNQIAAILQANREEIPDFAAKLQKCQTKCGNMPLDSYLLKPLQRLTRYPLLLNEILRKTPADHKDHASIKRAHAAAIQMVSAANEAARAADNEDELRAIAESLLVSDAR